MWPLSKLTRFLFMRFLFVKFLELKTVDFPMVALCSAVNDVYALRFPGCCAACTSRLIAALADAVTVSPSAWSLFSGRQGCHGLEIAEKSHSWRSKVSKTADRSPNVNANRSANANVKWAWYKKRNNHERIIQCDTNLGDSHTSRRKISLYGIMLSCAGWCGWSLQWCNLSTVQEGVCCSWHNRNRRSLAYYWKCIFVLL